MEKNEYEVMFNLEDDYWWYVGLSGTVFSCMDKFSCRKDGLRILDAGCGTGGILENCSGYRAYGFDLSEEAIKFCKIRKLKNIIKASVLNIPFLRDSFDLLISLDVMCNVGVKDEMRVLDEFCRVLNKGGILLLNLPAYNFLKGKHDKAVHIKHRYIRKELKKKVEKASFKIEKITYRNTILFPLIAVIRFLERIFFKNEETIKSDLKPLPKLLNKLLTHLLLLENRLIISSLNLPFGLSLFCVARKR